MEDFARNGENWEIFRDTHLNTLSETKIQSKTVSIPIPFIWFFPSHPPLNAFFHPRICTHHNFVCFVSGWDGKSVDVTQKIITSQSKIARLRSRLLRCITQVSLYSSSLMLLSLWLLIQGDNKYLNRNNNDEDNDIDFNN